MSDLRKAAEAVLERWDSPAWEWMKQGPTAELMATLRAALAGPEPEPVAWIWQIPLYTAPPAAAPDDAEALRRENERLREALAWAYNLRHLRGHSDPVVIPERFAPFIEAALQEVPR